MHGSLVSVGSNYGNGILVWIFFNVCVLAAVLRFLECQRTLTIKYVRRSSRLELQRAQTFVLEVLFASYKCEKFNNIEYRSRHGVSCSIRNDFASVQRHSGLTPVVMLRKTLYLGYSNGTICTIAIPLPFTHLLQVTTLLVRRVILWSIE